MSEQKPRAPWEGIVGNTLRTWDDYGVDIGEAGGWAAIYAGTQLFMDVRPFKNREDAMVACEIHAVQMSMLAIEDLTRQLDVQQRRLTLLLGLG